MIVENNGITRPRKMRKGVLKVSIDTQREKTNPNNTTNRACYAASYMRVSMSATVGAGG
jgi:hypothetical protein